MLNNCFPTIVKQIKEWDRYRRTPFAEQPEPFPSQFGF